MREIKFRGKRKDNGEWVYGSYAKHGKEHFIYDANLPVVYCVDPKTVGQFIGKHDKNGKEVYDGDKVRGMIDGEPCRWTVVWETDDMLGWSIDNTNEPFEVIGNIHDNPKLLNKD